MFTKKHWSLHPMMFWHVFGSPPKTTINHPSVPKRFPMAMPRISPPWRLWATSGGCDRWKCSECSDFSLKKTKHSLVFFPFVMMFLFTAIQCYSAIRSVPHSIACHCPRRWGSTFCIDPASPSMGVRSQWLSSLKECPGSTVSSPLRPQSLNQQPPEIPWFHIV